ncbi:type I polyketide synthase [Amycolatopsis sp. RTGN1]|uniref:type I polyketide synthase n=1 Tax=Amycolatopsis ponsaeliensis TaxID=2992142 RepID=UPI00254C8033|nr:type I polyketide synthase [Amycolatopsis sp. RTGN1]
MGARTDWDWPVVAVTPCGIPDAVLCAAAGRAGALGVLDLGRGDRAALEQLVLAADLAGGRPFGVRVTGACEASIADVVAVVEPAVVLLCGDASWTVADAAAHLPVLAEVTSVAEAHAAHADGAHGLIARGSESGGRVGELGSFVLLQQLLGDEQLPLPVLACGGIGPTTAAAAAAGGAAGVVLDTQLALLAECALPDSVQALLALSDGTNTHLESGHRFLPLGEDRLPVGQDCFLAARFAQRYGTTARAVRTVEDAFRSQDFGDAPAVAPDSAFARAMGITLPIAQGPMTRVSDQAGFARAVADAGALPFLALALSSADQTAALLAETSTRLGDRPWGVGVLGFAAEDIRAGQLRAIREVRPSVALIAGGRPDQAAVLEDAGIATFLHVPSPALLQQFLAAGARKFVFEGSECGGHVGPRTSFCLWQAAIDVLLDFAEAGGAADELHILFAGGIHDARSSAMVATAAAPLSDRGAAVGILMGTAYLFTDEAVEHGAVQPLFRIQAVAAESTVLLETAPGHVTRCLPSPFTDEFASLRRELQEQETDEREVWQRLEELNVGRLRIASKGIRRVGSDLIDVDEAGQHQAGLYMAGQVAVLRSATTGLARLHAEVTTGAVEFSAARPTPLGRHLRPEAPAPLDIAIVGISAMFPGAADLPAFWANILANVDAITEVSADRWDAERYYTEDKTPGTGEHTYSKWGGFLPQIPFDALRYGIPPAALASIEPVQLLALEAAQRALRDAGYEDKPFDREHTSVIFGTEAGSDLSRTNTLRIMLRAYLDEVPAELDEQLPRLTEDTFPGKLVNVIAGRIANRLDLGGANYTVDAACGSSLAAVDAACKELLTGDSNVVLCGGADLHNSIEDFLMFSSVGALSPRGRCRTFDAEGDGIALGEGVACLVLKRLDDAERDGDRVYAVIKGVGSGSDGRAMGLTAPRAEGQRRALDRAYRNAGVVPAGVGLVEAHGTGTVVGDRTELTTITKLYEESGAAPGSCTLGSVKSQIGHTKCAAGMAGLIKAALAVHTGVLPPTMITAPNPAWSPDSPFVFRTEPSPWLAPAEERVAGVSAFGFGGTNFHLVLAGHGTADLSRQSRTAWPAELFLIRSAETASAVRQLQRLRTLLTANETHGRPWALRDFAKTVSVWSARELSPVRFAFVAEDLDELIRIVDAVTSGETPPEVIPGADAPAGKIAVLFPGQGSQRPGMLAELFATFPQLHRIARHAGPVLDTVFPPAAFDAAETRAQRDRLRDTRRAQPALGIAGLAVHELLTLSGVRADMFAGHSYGELVALTAAGALAPDVLLRLSAARAESIVDAAGADPGAMAAVSASAAEVERVLAGIGDVVVANRNAPDQTVIAGTSPAIEVALAALRDASLSATQLPVACAFHSPVVAAAGNTFGAVLADVTFRERDRPVWSNRTAAPYPADADAPRAELAAQIGSPVLFAEQIEAMYADGARVFVEAGPGSVLSGLVDKILHDRPHTVVSPGENGLRGFLTGLARLATAGVDVRAGWLHSGRPGRDLTFAEPPERPRWTIDGHRVRTADGDVIPGGLAPARRVNPFSTSRTDTLPDPTGRDALVADFLRTSRELVTAQRDVMLGYLGAPTTSPAAFPVPEPVALPAPVPAITAVVEPEAPPAPAGDPLSLVVGVIARRTGYPPDMIDPDLDLEADLSVDSIKRTEIAGELAGGRDLIDDLVRSRTAGAMAAVLGGPAPASAEPTEPAAAGSPPGRFVLDLVATPATPDAEALIGAAIAIAGGDPRIAEELAGRLSASGADPVVLGEAGIPEDTPFDGLISLHALSPVDEPLLPELYPLFASALPRVRWCVAVAGPGAQSWGLRGFFRSIAREYPDTLTRLVEIDATEDETEIAELVAGELQDRTGGPVVRHNPLRRVPDLVETPLGGLAVTGAGPAGDGTTDLAAAGLSSDSVVLLVGGARGITARVAVELAAATRCRIELAGRTQTATDAEPAEIAAATDLAALRGALAKLGHRDPAEIDRRAKETLARREVEGTLTELRGHGSMATYHSVDATDADAVGRLVKQVHAEHGRLDLVVFAAGVIEDRLVADKDAKSFARVYRTKVEGARALLGALDELPDLPRAVVFFGSIAAVLGNRGQSDYAAANDALEALGSSWSARGGARALTVHWGPWAPEGPHGGMVSEELARSYTERGISLLAPDAAVAALFRELAWGDVPTVLYTASAW